MDYGRVFCCDDTDSTAGVLPCWYAVHAGKFLVNSGTILSTVAGAWTDY